MINLQNCKSQTPVESYITSSVVRGAPVTPTPAATAASRRAGRPWSCSQGTQTSELARRGSRATTSLLGWDQTPRGQQNPKPNPSPPGQQPPAPTANIPLRFICISTPQAFLPTPSQCSSTTKTQLVHLPNFSFGLTSVLLHKNMKLLHILLKF